MNVHPITFNVGDKVKILVRFGETGTIVEINPKHANPFGVKIKNQDMILFYNADELTPLGTNEKSFTWFKMPSPE